MDALTPMANAFEVNKEAPPHECKCNKQSVQQIEKYVYAIGKLSVRWPSMGLEREYQQRSRALSTINKQQANVDQVLSANFHIAKFACYFLSVDSVPAYIVRPTGLKILENMIGALNQEDEDEKWVVAIGKRGNISDPAYTSGIVAPEMYCDVIYVFTTKQLIDSLHEMVKPILTANKWNQEDFKKKCKKLFHTIVSAPDNLGSMDGQRALNYLSVQHPGPYLAVMEFDDKATLESIDSKISEGPAGQRIATIIMKFVDKLTGIPNRVYARVDVTEEWPFAIGLTQNDNAPMAMSVYTDASYS